MGTITTYKLQYLIGVLLASVSVPAAAEMAETRLSVEVVSPLSGSNATRWDLSGALAEDCPGTDYRVYGDSIVSEEYDGIRCWYAADTYGLFRMESLPLRRPTATFSLSSDNRYLFGDKEYSNFNGESRYDFIARTFSMSGIPYTDRLDPHADNRPNESPLIIMGANPVMNIDPTGTDWFCKFKLIWLMEQETFDVQTEIKYTECKSQEEFSASGTEGIYLGETIIDFHGSRKEKLGKGAHLNSKRAVTAKVTVYGARGADDIGEYTGFSMSSDFKRFGAIADGLYDVSYREYPGDGKIPKNYKVNNCKPVDCIDGKNPYKGGYSKTQKNAIFIHRTNLDGYAGLTEGGAKGVSVGCLLILAKEWNRFERQIGRKNIKLILRRD